LIDLDVNTPIWAATYEYRYRPYLVPDGDGFRHVDLRESFLVRLLRRYTHLYQAYVALMRTSEEPPLAQVRSATHIGSYFYDFTQARYALLEESLARLAVDAGGRPVFVVLIPDIGDLVRYHQDGPDPLSRKLRASGEVLGFRVVSLLPGMHDRTSRWNDYFHTCDFHWSAEGHRIAATIIHEDLRGEVYSE
jgi:hypothetical protein